MKGGVPRIRYPRRASLPRLFAGSLAGEPLKSSGYHQKKLAYSVGYDLVLWLLLFGTLGFFQARCNGNSAAWRYLADSSYWVYLAHLPLVAGLQVWMARWVWPAPVKFALLLVIAFIVLYAGYHYLVRSTFIGRTLNGRAYPFHWNPLHALGPATKQVKTAYTTATLKRVEP